MKKVILINGDTEVTIAKGSYFKPFEEDDVVYMASVSSIKDGVESLTIIQDSLLQNYLLDFVISSLSD